MNYEELLNIPYKPWKLLITMTIIIIICGLIIINIEIYDVYNTYAYYKEGNIVLITLIQS